MVRSLLLLIIDTLTDANIRALDPILFRLDSLLDILWPCPIPLDQQLEEDGIEDCETWHLDTI